MQTTPTTAELASANASEARAESRALRSELNELRAAYQQLLPPTDAGLVPPPPPNVLPFQRPWSIWLVDFDDSVDTRYWPRVEGYSIVGDQFTIEYIVDGAMRVTVIPDLKRYKSLVIHPLGEDRLPPPAR